MNSVWRPMDTAPKTGEPILLELDEPVGLNFENNAPGVEMEVVIGWWVDYEPGWTTMLMENDSWAGGIFTVSVEPTGWMPLPKRRR